MSPFLHQSLPGYYLNPNEEDMSENSAYKLAWPLSLDPWPATDEDPSGWRVEGHAMIRHWGADSSFGVEGSRGCMRSCFDRLERQERCEQTFVGGRFIRRPRWMLSYRAGEPTPESKRDSPRRHPKR
jgi:hypothetical protein